MPDTVATRVLYGGTRSKKYVVKLLNISDGTGESNVAKVTLSGLTRPDGSVPSRVTIEEIQWAIQGFSYVRLSWDRTTDVVAAYLTGTGSVDYSNVGGLRESSTGDTGNILLTTAGAVSGCTYDITLVCRLEA